MKKKVTSNDLFQDEAPFEVQPIQQKPEEIASSFEELIKRELTKYDSVVPAVNELAKEFMPLKIESIEDKDGYNEVSKALRFIVSKRTAVEEKRKELKADSLAYGRAVDARAKEITSMLEPIESHLKNEKLRIDSEIERLKAEEEERKQKFINDRIAKLIGLNMFQTMTEFVWKSKLNPEEEETFLRVNLELFSDDDFNSFVYDLNNKIDTENKIIAEKEAKMKIETEELERKRKEVDKEMQEMKAERAVARNQKLTELGLGTLSFNPHWVFVKVSSAGMNVINIIHNDEVFNLSSAEWNDKLEEIKSQISKLKLELEESKSVEEKKSESDIEPTMSDKDLYLDYLLKLKSVSAPQMKTKKWQSYIQIITQALENFKKIN